MPSKPRHGKRKHSTPRRAEKEKQLALAATTRQPVAGQALMPAHPGKNDSKVSIPAPSASQPADKYQYIIAEVRRISILAGIILLILIVLALVLPRT